MELLTAEQHIEMSWYGIQITLPFLDLLLEVSNTQLDRANSTTISLFLKVTHSSW